MYRKSTKTLSLCFLLLTGIVMSIFSLVNIPLMSLSASQKASALNSFSEQYIVIDTSPVYYNGKSPYYPVSYTEPGVDAIITYSQNNSDFYSGPDFEISYVFDAGTKEIFYKIEASGFEAYTGSYEMEIRKADCPDLDASKIKFTSKAKTLKDIKLPKDWVWVLPDTKLIEGKQQVECKYNGADKLNYKTLTLLLEIDMVPAGANPWQIVFYVMIPVCVIITIINIIYWRKKRFNKQFLDD